MYIKEIHRFVITLALFVAFNSFIVNGVIIVGDRQENTLAFIFTFFSQGTPYTDSWRPVAQALHFVHDNPSSDHTVYDWLFFEQRVKFSYPPTCLLLFEPLRLLPGFDRTALPFVNSISWLLFLGTAVITARIFIVSLQKSPYYRTISTRHPAETWILTGLAILTSLTFFPLVRGFLLGQIQTWMSFLFAAAVLAWITDHKKTSGVFIAIVCAIKPQLWPLGLWGLVRREWGFVGSLCATVALFIAASISLYGFETNTDYLRVLIYIAQHGESYYPNQSVNGLLNRLLMNGNNLNWDGGNFAPFHPAVYIGTAVTFLVLTGIAIFSGWRKKASIVDLGIVVVSATITSPIAWEHHYGILLPVVAATLPIAMSYWNRRPAMIACFAIAYFLSSTYIDSTIALAKTGWNFLQSNMLIGAMMLLVLLYRLRKEAMDGELRFQTEEVRTRQREILAGELENAEVRPSGNLRPVPPEQVKPNRPSRFSE